jgi:hypothetical protein
MRRSIRYSVRLLVLIAVLASLQVLIPSATPPGTPYLSALSIAVSAPVHAAGCPDKQCINSRCQHVVGWTCASLGPGNTCSRTMLCQ